ncbi:MAG: glycosyltransferase [Candidatus Omnitrophica bacterium]|nr:glycosyltransferase [Candidatus Omnitrophota bacterium]
MNDTQRALKASVIIPMYNAASDIPNLLEALAAQTVIPEEVILVDDGSTDGSVDTAEEWRGNHPEYPIRILKQENRGPAKARNYGADESVGEILIFTDSDCLPDPGWVEGMTAPFSDPSVVGVQGVYQSRQTEAMARFAQLEIEDRYRRMRKNPTIDFIGTYSAAYRKSVFMEQGKFDDRFPIASGEDADLSYRLASKGLKMVFQPEAVVYHRHPNSLGKYLSQKFWRAYWRNLLYRRHSSRILKDSYTPQALKFETLLAILFPVSFLGLTLPFPWSYLPLAFVIGILILSLPFTLWVIGKDPVVGLISPFVILFRSFAFALGTGRGLLKGLWVNEDYL